MRFTLEKSNYYTTKALYQTRLIRDHDGDGQEQKNVYPEQCLTPAPRPRLGHDFKQKQNKTETNMVRAKYLSCHCSFDSATIHPLGSDLPPHRPLFLSVAVGLKSVFLTAVVQLVCDFAWQGTPGNTWRHFWLS